MSAAPSVAASRPSYPLKFGMMPQDDQFIGSIVGSKYTKGGSELLRSSSKVGDVNSVCAEIYQHNRLKCTSFVQPVTEIVVNVSGSANFRRRADGAEQKYLSQVGSASICPAGVEVRYLHIEAGPLKMLHFYLPTDLFGALQPVGDGTHIACLLYKGGINDPLIQSIGFAVAEELMQEERSEGVTQMLLESFGVGLAARLMQRYTRDDQRGLSESYFDAYSGRGLDRCRLSRVVEFIQENLDTDISLDDLAKIACLSVFHFCRAFKTATGASPFRYISEVRIGKAKTLLKDPYMSIDDIALSTGFSSGANLARAFKKFVGVSPTQYRSKCCG